MNTPRDHLRRVLDARQPDAAAWARKEEALLAALERRRRGTWWVAVPTLLATAVAGWLVFAPRAPVLVADSTDIYLRAAGESDAAAMRITLTVHPRKTP